MSGFTRLCVAFALAASLLGAEGPLPARTIRLGLLLEADVPLAPAVDQAFRQETAALFNVPWLTIHWGDSSPRGQAEAFDRVVIIRLRGACSPHAGTADRPEPGALGITHVSDGHILPFVQADCAGLLGASTRLRSLPFRLGHTNLGRALARVVAHEIYHVLSGSSEHDSEGLTKPSLRPAELFLPGFGFAPAALERIAAALTPRGLLASLAEPSFPVP